MAFFRESDKGGQEAVVVKARVDDDLDSGGQLERTKDGLSVW